MKKPDRKKLPIGIQTLAKIRENDCYYVDKTHFALRLIREGSHYFLSRPRRFGKSLFLDTLKELFQGNKALFKGLYCYDQWDWSVTYPVIQISFAEGVYKSRSDLDERIREILFDNQKRLGLECRKQSIAGTFSELIEAAHEKYGQRTVVLVDEYDKPILDNITQPETAQEMRDGLRNLYSVIKGRDAYIKFAFLTGVSKFSKVSLFSGLNNLEDITVNTEYSAICGYTETDLDTVFIQELKDLDREQIHDWYNGYNWTGEAVYNPFDLLLLFKKRSFEPFWFETGTPTFLVELLTQRGFFTPAMDKLRVDEGILSAFDVDYISAEALLWQTGYLTFIGSRILGARKEYTLGYPNMEVESALNDALAKALVGNPEHVSELASRLYDLMVANDFDGLKQHLKSLFASIPHDWYRNNPIAQYEGYYASIFYSHFAALGLDLIPEDTTHHGRIDMTVRFNQNLYLFEFKVVELTPKGSALQQLKYKNYAEKYRAEHLPIHLIGIEFSKESRTVTGFETETL